MKTSNNFFFKLSYNKSFSGVEFFFKFRRFSNFNFTVLTLSVWYSLRGHTYLNKPAAFSAAAFFKYV